MQLQSPYLLKYLYPSLHWEVKTTEKVIYLTFDDGPHPEISLEVLKILEEKDAKATFFCVGENVKKHPDTYQKILDAGHRTANHCFNHLNGWKTPNKTYFDNVALCAKWVDSDLFRPPYGRITPSQIAKLKHQYRIIMWSVITYDFDQSLTKEACLDIGLKKSGPGSIIVFHDSVKAAANMRYALPRFIDHFKALSYRFEVL